MEWVIESHFVAADTREVTLSLPWAPVALRLGYREFERDCLGYCEFERDCLGYCEFERDCLGYREFERDWVTVSLRDCLGYREFERDCLGYREFERDCFQWGMLRGPKSTLYASF
jgi:hypothetical protein